MNPPYVLDRTARERVHYFSRQLITAEDMVDEQNFFLQKLRRHNRFLHGWGVVCGCTVEAAPSEYPWRVKISTGYVLDPIGNEIWLSEPYFFDIAGHMPSSGEPCVPAGSSRKSMKAAAESESESVFLCVCYDECDARPVRVHPAGCGCEEASCEYSRVRDSFCVRALDEVPAYQTKAEAADAKWLASVGAWFESGRNGVPPMPPCPEPAADSCVVLAKISLPAARAPLEASSVDNSARHVLYSAHSLAGFMRSLP